ncbi:tetratricopeptide repeat protein [Methanogenium sp. MK-MG]|uniref:tetratricopeptide repeat protein n=1 Tax=Methanogenium sp. MK-MG TaxID=2599926 RepID=UPI0013ED83A0|nr:tetratricopeptide repeat protein [Methanogenium sp. MK-MG]KAF1078401.1 hypothetical protein MKMG_00649 [Methanogenium sp. MK-MG]
MLKNVGIVAAVFLCCVSVGCIADTENPDTMPTKEFLEKVNASQEYYDALVVSDPDNAEAWCYRGMYYNDHFGQYDEAMESSEKALELNPEYGLAWYLKGIILMNTGKNDEAKLSFQNATKYDIGLTTYIPSI